MGKSIFWCKRKWGFVFMSSKCYNWQFWKGFMLTKFFFPLALLSIRCENLDSVCSFFLSFDRPILHCCFKLCIIALVIILQNFGMATIHKAYKSKIKNSHLLWTKDWFAVYLLVCLCRLQNRKKLFHVV